MESKIKLERCNKVNTHIMGLNPDALKMMGLGTKTIEMRLYDENGQRISKGDYIDFISTNNEGNKLKVKVKELYRYNNFEELYVEFDKTKLGYREDEIAHYTDMEQYYSKEKIKQYGVIGIEVEVIRNSPCPCCGFITIPNKGDALAYICPVCFWEIDLFINSDDEPSDQNHGLTLNEARKNYEKHGVVMPNLKEHCREPKEWEYPNK